MIADDDFKSYQACNFPTEILLHIFKFLPAKELCKCRQVCLRWKYMIDGLQESNSLWREHCRRDYKDVYKVARSKSRAGLTWYNIYKSLSLWPKLASARDIRDEFASASGDSEEILNFQVLENGIIGVHRKASIVYYDIESLELSKRKSVSGKYLSYNENQDTIIVLNIYLHLYITRKVVPSDKHVSNSYYDNVKTFLLVDRVVYFVNMDEEIYAIQLDDEHLQEQLVKRCPEAIMCLGYSKNRLNVLTYERNIFSVNCNELVFLCTLGSTRNLLHKLNEYNFFEHLDWWAYVQWLHEINQSISEFPLSAIRVIRTYRDFIFVGCEWGVLRIYYAPFTGGELNLTNAVPIKQYNFMESPILIDDCSIVQIDVLEAEDGHTVLVAMPKKIVVLDFVHGFKRTASAAMLPYRDVQRVKILRLDDTV